MRRKRRQRSIASLASALLYTPIFFDHLLQRLSRLGCTSQTLAPYTPSIINSRNDRKKLVVAPRASTRGVSSGVPKGFAREASSASVPKITSRTAGASRCSPFDAARSALANTAMEGETISRTYQLSSPAPPRGLPRSVPTAALLVSGIRANCGSDKRSASSKRESDCVVHHCISAEASLAYVDLQEGTYG